MAKKPSLERKATKKRVITKRVKKYQQPTTGKWIKGYTKTIKKYPRKYRTFRMSNGSMRFVEVTRIGKKEKVEILDKDANYRRELSIKQPDHMKKSVPSTKFMNKDINSREIEAFERISEEDRERSFAIDFERYLNNPERYAITIGGYSSTMKIGDFEVFGHSHPCDDTSQRLPSAADLKNAHVFRPEFIITHMKYEDYPETELYFFNIEDFEKYETWKERYKTAGKNEAAITDLEIHTELAKLIAKEKDPKQREKLKQLTITQGNLLDSELGRKIFFERTGVKLYPYDKTMRRINVEIPDDPRPESATIPGASKKSLQEWQTHLIPASTREQIEKKRKGIERSYFIGDKPSLEAQLYASEAIMVSLNNMREEGIWAPYVIDKEFEKENKRYVEIAHKIEQANLKNPNLHYKTPDEITKIKLTEKKRYIDKQYRTFSNYTIEDQLLASQEYLDYLKYKHDEGIMSKELLEKERDKEFKHYEELSRQKDDNLLKNPNK